ncbi:hypothetical protein IWX49DRAFT_236246 [Phyllosticta citricarpa]
MVAKDDLMVGEMLVTANLRCSGLRGTAVFFFFFFFFFLSWWWASCERLQGRTMPSGDRSFAEISGLEDWRTIGQLFVWQSSAAEWQRGATCAMDKNG